MEDISRTVSQINALMGSVSAAVEQQGTATQEISHSMGAAARRTESVSNNTASIMQASAETGQTANYTLTAASELSKQAEFLKREVQKFIVRVRAW